MADKDAATDSPTIGIAFVEQSIIADVHCNEPDVVDTSAVVTRPAEEPSSGETTTEGAEVDKYAALVEPTAEDSVPINTNADDNDDDADSAFVGNTVEVDPVPADVVCSEFDAVETSAIVTRAAAKPISRETVVEACWYVDESVVAPETTAGEPVAAGNISVRSDDNNCTLVGALAWKSLSSTNPMSMNLMLWRFLL